MNVQVVGCSHHNAPIEFRERLAMDSDRTSVALDQWQKVLPETEVVVLSTCNRLEVYSAAEDTQAPGRPEVAEFLARFQGLDPVEVGRQLYSHAGEEAIRHLFTVTCSLDSMVLGEAQILSQVKQAYQLAASCRSAGPVTHGAFQAALRVARRVASETAIHQRRVSIPSVAVADFAKQIFERFDDKETLIIGAGEMAEETLRYLQDEGARRITVVNRSFERASELAQRWQGRALPWEQLDQALTAADLVISTTGAGEPIVTLEQFEQIEGSRGGRVLFVLDLAVPRDFDPAIDDRSDVYLYSVDDLTEACQRNRARRDKELPAAMKIIEQEASRFMADLHHRATGPVIERLRRGWQGPKEEELQRLLNKLPELDDRARDEIGRSFDRLVNKLLHPPLELLRDESRHGVPHVLLDALSRLFRLKD
ncbi:MAG: glutamyl-tRNA reductase [Candidatus Nealsonbacteria bacterium]|nr:glutamyl-tRNA reductase [Candidatus Nealsonbacteria bacterium]